MKSYCLFCISGKEGDVGRLLSHLGYEFICPTVVQWTGGNANPVRSMRRLMPGYVFFETDAEPDWVRILRDSSVIKLLKYDDETYALRGADAEFVEWLKKYDGCIRISEAVQVGRKIKFVSGPLKDFNGEIVKINKGRRQVQIALGGGEHLVGALWCSMEFVQENVDAAKLLGESDTAPSDT